MNNPERIINGVKKQDLSDQTKKDLRYIKEKIEQANLFKYVVTLPPVFQMIVTGGKTGDILELLLTLKQNVWNEIKIVNEKSIPSIVKSTLVKATERILYMHQTSYRSPEVEIKLWEYLYNAFSQMQGGSPIGEYEGSVIEKAQTYRVSLSLSPAENQIKCKIKIYNVAKHQLEEVDAGIIVKNGSNFACWGKYNQEKIRFSGKFMNDHTRVAFFEAEKTNGSK